MRAQSVLLTFCGAYVLDRGPVAASSFVCALAELGIGEYATRSGLTRMVDRGLLRSHRSGRQVYFGLTDMGRSVLTEASQRVWGKGVVLRHWNGKWTVLGFSLPESRRAERHRLRARLRWAGFGMLQPGLWISPHPVDLRLLSTQPGVEAYIRSFVGRPSDGTDVASMISTVWDLESLGVRYDRFLERWDTSGPVPEVTDRGRRLLFATEWLLLVREDPCLPRELLPDDWPGLRAQTVARRLRSTFFRRSRTDADAIVYLRSTA
jgi:phenylacetic acid degradation operon negative regulatory protein